MASATLNSISYALKEKELIQNVFEMKTEDINMLSDSQLGTLIIMNPCTYRKNMFEASSPDLSSDEIENNSIIAYKQSLISAEFFINPPTSVHLKLLADVLQMIRLFREKILDEKETLKGIDLALRQYNLVLYSVIKKMNLFDFDDPKDSLNSVRQVFEKKGESNEYYFNRYALSQHQLSIQKLVTIMSDTNLSDVLSTKLICRKLCDSVLTFEGEHRIPMIGRIFTDPMLNYSLSNSKSFAEKVKNLRPRKNLLAAYRLEFTCELNKVQEIGGFLAPMSASEIDLARAISTSQSLPQFESFEKFRSMKLQNFTNWERNNLSNWKMNSRASPSVYSGETSDASQDQSTDEEMSEDTELLIYD